MLNGNMLKASPIEVWKKKRLLTILFIVNIFLEASKINVKNLEGRRKTVFKEAVILLGRKF